MFSAPAKLGNPFDVVNLHGDALREARNVNLKQSEKSRLIFCPAANGPSHHDCATFDSIVLLARVCPLVDVFSPMLSLVLLIRTVF